MHELHPRLLEVHEVAYHLKCSQETVCRLIRVGKLVGVRLTNRSLRVKQADLDAFVDARRTQIAAAERAIDAQLATASRQAHDLRTRPPTTHDDDVPVERPA